MGDEISTVPKAGETPSAWLTRTSSAAEPLPVPGLGPDAAPQDPSPKPGERPADWLGRTTAAADPNFEAIAGTGLNIPVDRAARILKAQSRSGYSTEFIDKNLDAVEGDIKRSGFDVERLRAGSPLTAKFLKENPARVGLFAADMRGLTDNEKLLAMAADPDVRLRPFTPKEVQDQAERLADQQDREWLASPMNALGKGTHDLAEDHSVRVQQNIDRIRAEEAVIAQAGKIDYAEVLKNKARENPFFLAPLLTAVDPLEDTFTNYMANKRLEASRKAGARLHSQADEELLTRAFRYHLAKARRGETTGGEISGMVADLPAFVGSLAMTGVLSRGVAGFAGGVSEGVATEAGTMAPGIAARAVGVMAQAPFALPGQTVESALKMMTPTGQAVPDEAGNFTYQVDDGTGKSAAVAIPQALIGSMIDVGTANINFNPIYKLWAGKVAKVATPTVEGFLRDVARKGMEGVISFIGVNEVAKVAKAAAGIQPYELPTWQNLKAQAFVGGTLAVGHRTFEHYEAWHANSKAQATVDTLGKVAENIKVMQAASKSPEEIQKATEAQLPAGAKFTFLPAPDFAVHFEQQGIDPHEMATELTGDPTALDDALRDGHDIQVPTAAYLVKIGTTPDGAFFQPTLRIDPNKPNLDESQKHLAELDSAMEAERQAQREARAAAAEKKGQVAQPAAEEPSMPEQIGKKLREQLEAAGFKAEAKQYQALVESGFKQFAEKAKAAGIDPAEFLKRYTPTVDKGAPPEGEGQFVKVMDQSGTHVEKVAGDTPAEAVLEAHKKWADATIEPMTEEEVRNFLPLAMERPDAAVTLDQPAYHGSPYKFRKFSLNKIGSGEGHQAYGWGLYFAGKKGVAEYYRDTLGGIERDKKFDFSDYSSEGADIAHRELGAAYGNEAEAIKAIEQEIEFQNHDNNADDETLQPLHDAITLLENGAFKKSGRIYTVEIPDDGAYLDWDKPLSKQNDKVRAAVAKYYGIEKLATPEELKSKKYLDKWDKVASMTGEQFYQELAQDLLSEDERGGVWPEHMGPQMDAEAASKLLAAAGIPGITYLDQTSRAKGSGSHNFVLFDDKLAQIKSYEQPGEGGEPRGQIRIGDSAISISLLEKADPSTFLHETGHLYLEMLGDLAGHEKATDQVKGDFATVLDWLGVKERGEIGRVQHEQFARGFEAYLMKGEAPSAKLRLAFDRFKSWLLEVYKNIRNLDVELNPKVRGVFDRLLASEEEIQSAYEARGRREAFLSAAPDLKMSEADAAKYADLIGQAHEAARSQLDREALADIREQETEKYQRAREATRKAVEDEVNALPEQVALARLQRHRTPDGKELPEGTPKLKLDRASIDPEVLKRLPRGVTGQDGLTPDGAAEQLGFPSGEALLSGLQRAVDVEGYGIPSPKEVEIRTNLAHLEATRKALEMMREPLEAEAKEATADAMAGKKAIAAELARSMRQEERAKVADLKQMLQDVRDRGGIRPSDPKTELLPRKFRARGQEGVGSDEVAQELYDRGILKDATSDDLYEWLRMVDSQVQASRDRIKAIAGEANELAKRKVKEALEAFVENAKQQEKLREELDRSAAERRTLEGGILKNPREAIVERTTNERMAQTHPKPVETLDDKALEAIHNDKEAKLKAYEIKWLLENKPNALKGLLRVVTDPVKYVASVAAYADQKMLGETDRATAAGKYQTGERQARIAAREALLKNDIDGAIGFKQRELLNHELFRAATEMKADVREIAKWMRRIEDKDWLSSIGKADPASRDQLIDLARRFEFSKDSAGKRASKQLLVDFLKDKMTGGVGEEFQTPSFVLDTAFRVNYQDLKYGELLQLRDFAKQVETTARLTNYSMALEKRVTREEMKRGVIEGIRKNGKERGPQATDSAMGALDHMFRLGRQINAGLIRTEQWVREADGADITGPIREYFFNGSVEAQKAELDLQVKVGALVVKAIETLPENLRKGLSEKISMPGRRVITMYDVFGFAAQAGNASNWQKFLAGEQMRTGGHTPGEIISLINRLTPEHAKVIQEGIWDAQETLWPLIDEKHQKWTGLKLPKVEVGPQHPLFTGMRGGYMPVIYEAGLSKQGQMQEAARVGELQQDGYHSATIASGHRKARIEEFARPMDTDLRNLPGHVATVIKDLTHREWMIDANFLLNDEEVRHAVTEHYGPEMIKRLEEWVKQTVNSRNQSSTQSVSGLRQVYEGARLNMVSAMMLLKATTLLKHATSSAAAVDMIGNGDLVKGAKYYAMGVEKSLRPRQAYDEMIAKSVEMPHFLENNDREMHENIERLKGRTGYLAKVQMLGSYVVGMMNLSRAMPAWWGEYFRAMDEFPAEKGLSGAELEKYAAMSADEVVRSSVGTSHAKDLSAVMAAKGDLMRAFTLGYTPGMVLYSRIHDVATRYGRDKNVPRLIASLLMTGIVAGTLHEVVGGNFPNTKKDEGWGPWWLKSIGSYFASALPMGRDAVEYLLHGRESSSVNPMVHDAKMIMRAVESGAGAFNGDDPEKFIVDSARAAEYFAGLPTDQALTTGEYMYDLQSGKADKPNDLWTFYHDFLHGQHRKK